MFTPVSSFGFYPGFRARSLRCPLADAAIYTVSKGSLKKRIGLNSTRTCLP